MQDNGIFLWLPSVPAQGAFSLFGQGHEPRHVHYLHLRGAEGRKASRLEVVPQGMDSPTHAGETSRQGRHRALDAILDQQQAILRPHGGEGLTVDLAGGRGSIENMQQHLAISLRAFCHQKVRTRGCDAASAAISPWLTAVVGSISESASRPKRPSASASTSRVSISYISSISRVGAVPFCPRGPAAWPGSSAVTPSPMKSSVTRRPKAAATRAASSPSRSQLVPWGAWRRITRRSPRRRWVLSLDMVLSSGAEGDQAVAAQPEIDQLAEPGQLEGRLHAVPLLAVPGGFSLVQQPAPQSRRNADLQRHVVLPGQFGPGIDQVRLILGGCGQPGGILHPVVVEEDALEPMAPGHHRLCEAQRGVRGLAAVGRSHEQDPVAHGGSPQTGWPRQGGASLKRRCPSGSVAAHDAEQGQQADEEVVDRDVEGNGREDVV